MTRACGAREVLGTVGELAALAAELLVDGTEQRVLAAAAPVGEVVQIQGPDHGAAKTGLAYERHLCNTRTIIIILANRIVTNIY